MAEGGWDELPDDVVQQIDGRLPCPLDRVFMAACCKSWRTAPVGPPARSLPCFILPLVRGPSVACILGGGALHGLDLPADARRARFFGSYEGMWAFVALRRRDGHVLLNVRTGERIPLPDIEFGKITRFRRAVYDENGAIQTFRWAGIGGPRRPVMMLAATLSRAPAVDDEECVAGAILNVLGPEGRVNHWRYVCFWRLGSQMAIQAQEVSSHVGWSPQDIAYFDGRFYVLTKGEHLRTYTVLNEPDPNREGVDNFHAKLCNLYHTGRGDKPDDAVPRAGYLVVSRGQLLMVVKEWMPDDGATSCIRLFALTPAVVLLHDDPDSSLAWTAVESLDGRLLVVGPGCSRAYECAHFPSGCIQEGVYFLDDRTYYNYTFFAPYFPEQSSPDEFTCTDNGRCRLLPALPEHCFPIKPGESSFSTYSPPVWLLP
ncbi:hypothetical protein QYE76_001037 [Lolium multiflorum]|uniref:KIB1-4 beta-propeller domain-containing protein n=1 Tax=Lolium multiflorum TaxID=4521 RepID=A0AAD8RLA4_LOLMU|nr:hypothetical protein QYE76_001037 [Lolium multiflorum]